MELKGNSLPGLPRATVTWHYAGDNEGSVRRLWLSQQMSLNTFGRSRPSWTLKSIGKGRKNVEEFHFLNSGSRV